MTITALTAAILLILLRAPDTPIARSLHRLLIAPAATGLERIRRGQVVMLLILAAAMWLLGREGAQLIAMGVPEAATWLALVDAASLLDVAAALAVTAALVPLRPATAKLKPVIARIRRLRSSRASRHARRDRAEARSAANDDGADRHRRAA